ncbi:MAG TPA: hypothetical protein VMI55_03520 [Thermoplasmata archaeon]|nr:hypothetical protein [Thermoplasmata archaeon]
MEEGDVRPTTTRASPAAGTTVGDGGPARSLPPVRPEVAVLLTGVAVLLVFVALEPYLSFAMFGSDSGEYYTLTAALLATGHIPHGAAYAGWGSAYPDFPGIYLLAGAGSAALGISAFSGLTILVPTVAVLSVFPLFLLFRRLYPHDLTALLGASLASVAMPRLFTLAHAAPASLGDLLAVASLWMFLESRREVRWYLPLALTGGALIVTHHLSTYFFVLGALGGLLLLELWRPGLWSHRFPTRELVFLGSFVTATLLFWFYGTYSFVSKVLLPGLAHSSLVGFGALEGAGLLAVVVAGVLIHLRRRRFAPRRAWVRLPTDRSIVRDAALLAVGIFGGIAVLLVVPLPGTTQTTAPLAILWFAPVLLLAVLCAGSRRLLTTSRLGPFALTWLGILAISAVGTLLASELGSSLQGFVEAIPPSRHAEYLLIPVGLLGAVAAGRLVARIDHRAGRRAATAAVLGLVVLVAANAAIVYPPQAYLGGFQEGLTHGDAALWMWVGVAAPPTWTVASDHRLSSVIFGVDGNPTTWTTTPVLFTGNASQAAEAYAELRSSGTPYTLRPIDLVAVDSVMYAGVALNPSVLAAPLSPAAIAWLSEAPFVPLYEDGQNVVYLVDAPLIPAG